MPLKAKPGCCEEAAPESHDFYIPCNRPAVTTVAFVRRGEGPYRMCAPCAAHNTNNRGAERVPADWKPERKDA